VPAATLDAQRGLRVAAVARPASSSSGAWALGAQRGLRAAAVARLASAGGGAQRGLRMPAAAACA